MSRFRPVGFTAVAVVGVTVAVAGCGSSSGAAATSASSIPAESTPAAAGSAAASSPMSPSGMASAGMSPSGMASAGMSPSGMASGGMASGHGAATGTLTAVNQTSTGMSLTVADVTLGGTAQGWVAVHLDVAGKPGPVVGEAAVKKGNTKNVVVHFTHAVKTGAFWPMLHVDDHVIGVYEFPKVKGADLPVIVGSAVVMKKITLTVG